MGATRGAAASALIVSLAKIFTKFEEASRSREKWAIFCSLPFAVVLQVLSSNELVVKSENTAAVAALSWLRGKQGKAATLAERKQVLQQVRLLQLSPFFVAVLVGEAPEAQELLGPEVGPKLLRHLASPAASRTEYKAADKQLQQWAEPRNGGGVGMTLEVKLSVSEQEVLEAVGRCRADGKTETMNGEGTFFDGLFWAPAIEYSRGEGKNVEVWAGLRATLEIGAEQSEQRSILQYSMDFKVTVGERYKAAHISRMAAANLGGGRGYILAKVGEEDDPKALLKSCFKDGRLTLQVTLLQGMLRSS